MARQRGGDSWLCTRVLCTLYDPLLCTRALCTISIQRRVRPLSSCFRPAAPRRTLIDHIERDPQILLAYHLLPRCHLFIPVPIQVQGRLHVNHRARPAEQMAAAPCVQTGPEPPQVMLQSNATTLVRARSKSAPTATAGGTLGVRPLHVKAVGRLGFRWAKSNGARPDRRGRPTGGTWLSLR